MVSTDGFKYCVIASLVLSCVAALFLLIGLVTPGWTVLKVGNFGDTDGTGSSVLTVTYSAGLWYVQICASSCMLESLSSMGGGLIKNVVRQNLVGYQAETTIAMVLTLTCIGLTVTILKFPQHPTAMLCLFGILMLFHVIAGGTALLACGSKAHSTLRLQHLYDFGVPYSLIITGVGALCSIAAVLVLIRPLKETISSFKLRYRLPPRDDVADTTYNPNSTEALWSSRTNAKSKSKYSAKSQKKTLKEYKPEYAVKSTVKDSYDKSERELDDNNRGYSNGHVGSSDDGVGSMDVSVIHYTSERKRRMINPQYPGHIEPDMELPTVKPERTKGRASPRASPKPKPRPRRTKPKPKSHENPPSNSYSTEYPSYPPDGSANRTTDAHSNYPTDANYPTDLPDTSNYRNQPTDESAYYPTETLSNYPVDHRHVPEIQPNPPSDANSPSENLTNYPNYPSYPTDERGYYSTETTSRYQIDPRDPPEIQPNYATNDPLFYPIGFNDNNPPENNPSYPDNDRPFYPTSYTQSPSTIIHNYPKDDRTQTVKHNETDFNRAEYQTDDRSNYPDRNETNFTSDDSSNYHINYATNYLNDNPSINPLYSDQVDRLDNRNRDYGARHQHRRDRDYDDRNYSRSPEHADYSYSSSYSAQETPRETPRKSRTRRAPRTRPTEAPSHITLPKSHETTI